MTEDQVRFTIIIILRTLQRGSTWAISMLDEQLVQDFAGRPQAVLSARRMGPRLHHCIGAGLQTAAAANQNLSDRLGAADGRRSPHARLPGTPRYWRAAHGFLLPGLGALLRARATAVE